MPGYNKTGPIGQGSMTGRGLGACNTDAQSSFFLPGAGFGRGMGMRRGNRFGQSGYGMGFCRQFAMNQASSFNPYPKDNNDAVKEDAVKEIDMLKAQANSVQSTLDQINTRINDLEKK
eukprot:CAMPEP_0201285728 /NCGR_PEP_ID=MMETSP1317-20130820/113739_1 /ASSEMBLY_ACC=CAM_ASM_000770 /TAXON_ID=187299 /ORGANISM="Undescribed Undescribed, Strain Undescribed" /LENGTH=117 /DNA_ID=CAMNT_0047611573 /DNA_START=530 /DNA_END=883 /DNA_ORIENTATION=+